MREELEVELNGVENQISEQVIKVKIKKFIYNFLFGLCIAAPILLLIVQLSVTRSSLIWQPSNPELWKSIKDSFSTVIGAFGILAAITGMYGFKFRARQLDLQQLRVSKQTILTRLQYYLSQQQFLLADRKENFMLLVEHNKRVREHIQEIHKAILEAHDNVDIYKAKLFIYWPTIYDLMFPSNSEKKVVNLSLIAEKPLWPQKVDELKRWARGLNEKIIKQRGVLEASNELLRGLGFNAVSTQSEELSDEEYLVGYIASFLVIPLLFQKLGLINQAEQNEIKNELNKAMMKVAKS